MNKIPILIVSSSYPRYKNDIAGLFIHELNKRLSKFYNIFVLSPYSKGLEKEEIIDNIKIIRFIQFPIINFSFGNTDEGMYESIKKNPFKILLLISYLVYQIYYIIKISKKENIKLIQYYWLIPNTVLNVLIKLFLKRTKTIVSILGSDYWSLCKPLLKDIKFYLMKNVNKIICVSSAMKKDAIINHFSSANNMDIIPMGIDTNNYFPLYSEKTISENFNILFVGLGCKAKGFDVLINSINQLSDCIKQLEIYIVSQSIDELLFKDTVSNEVINKFKLFSNIPNDEKIKYFQNCDLFILPSLSEGWPVVVMEALSCGCICIVTDIPTFEEYKDKYEFLHVVEKGNYVKLAEKILQIYNNYEYYKKFKKEAREFAINNFDWEIITKKYINKYEELLNETN